MSTIFRIDGWLLDIPGATLSRENSVVPITSVIGALLHFLCTRAGETVSRDELCLMVWQRNVTDHAIAQAVFLARQLFERKVIETIPKQGYRLPVRFVEEITTSSSSTSPGIVNVLLVEDHPFIRKVVKDTLGEIDNLEITAVSSAEDAIAILNNEPVGMLVTDVSLGQMNGLELSKRVRTGRFQCARSTPILVITSFTDPQILGTALLLDVDGFLSKPVTGRQIVAEIRRVQNGRSTRQNIKPHIAYSQIDANIDLGPGHHLSSTIEAHPDKPVLLVKIGDLREGMTLGADLYLADGRKIAAAQQALRGPEILLIEEHQAALAYPLVAIAAAQTT